MDIATVKQIDELLKKSDLFPQFNNHCKSSLASHNFSNETVLITGAAGSIGFELSKQISQCPFKKLILIDIAESPLYNLMNELQFKKPDSVKFIIINITQKDCLKQLFETYKPTIVFHAAAYKHVPLMETNSFESIKVNIFGTKYLADLATVNNVKKFIFISTDKAVNPINVMGISKRISEDYLAFLSNSTSTLFLSTRFGNIFSSNGSVVPLFKKNIDSGKPIIVTSKETSRYFIDKAKACSLILKIASNNYKSSNLYTFNMGKPIKIINLLERLIIFCNNKNVEILFSKLRDGEKLHEDLVSQDEVLTPTNDKDILLVEKRKKIYFPLSYFENLSKITAFTSHDDIKAVLKQYL
jgi:FlaA1/EpsC-like NDP-sugar epimerase